ncbi:MAG TPA: hypothetical protein VMT94_02120 [Burkholderiales bacterium]|nr:hypothetical protein [Burkholderiales bacterium]
MVVMNESKHCDTDFSARRNPAFRLEHDWINRWLSSFFGCMKPSTVRSPGSRYSSIPGNSRNCFHRFSAIQIGVLIIAGFLGIGVARAQPDNLAPGFTNLPKGARIVLMPADVELFSLSAGGVVEPKADWTEAAIKNLRTAFNEKQKTFGVVFSDLTDEQADEFAEINALHGAVARAIDIHHFGSSSFHLPTKEGKLDWSLGDEVSVIKSKTGADYALFSWIRDSYASGERVATMMFMAMLGVGLTGGMQVGYASLVDLNTGQVLWFNRLQRGTGDLREEDKAADTLNALLKDFPVAK